MAKKYAYQNGPLFKIGANKIIQYLSEGYTFRYIATVEKVHKRSIENAVGRLKREHECQSVPQLVGVFIKNGFIDGPEIKSASTFV